MEMDVEKISADIVGAVNIIMNPLTPSAERRRAQEMLDTFKDTSPLCAKCGFHLSAKHNSPTVRHCGFQLIDNFIKVHWNEIDVQQKLWIKDSILNCIASGTNPVLSEQVYIKDAVSRIVVELIKREWPQHWPSLMDELHNLCVMGDTQTELVLLIFSRLADDIVQFMNVPDVRRRDIYKTLVLHLPDLFSFFWKTLLQKVDSIENVKHSTELEMQNSRLIQVTLETLSTFVEWVPISYLVEIPLFKLLSKLLGMENLRMTATSCLLSIFERKGKEERKSVILFFEETEIFQEISGLNETILLSEQHYLFLRELCKCFLSLSSNLCVVITQDDSSVSVPSSLPYFLNCALILAKHPSLVISQYAQSLWLNICRNQVLRTTQVAMTLFPTLLKYQVGKLIKVGYPSKNNSIACKFSLLEFDSDEDFDRFLNKCRAEIAEGLRLHMNNMPELVFGFGKTLLTSLCEGKCWRDLDISSSELDETLCWDAMSVYMEAVCCILAKKDITIFKEYTDDAFQMINMCKNLETKDPVVLSYSLSCISSLFFFYTFAPENVSDVLNKIFSYFTAYPRQGPMDKEVQNLRRHASALMIKLSCNHPTLLLPLFDKLCETIQELFQSGECLTQFDRCQLLEAMMILSNQFCDFDRQAEFLKVLLYPNIQSLASPAILVGIASSEAFISFIGIDKPQQLAATTDFPVSKDVSDLMYALNIVRACCKRVSCPTDPEVAKKGKFIHPHSETTGTIYYRNPAAGCILPVLDKIIQLLKTLNGMHDPAVKLKIDPSCSTVLRISEGEKYTILGVPCSDSAQHQKLPSDRIKTYIQNMYEGCLYILANAVENFGIEFYNIPNLSSLLKDSILFQIQPFFLMCPPSAYDALMLILEDLCPFMLQKLNSVWENFKLRYGTSSTYEEQQNETEEILEDELNRLLTREYIQVLVELLQKQNTKVTNGDSMDDGQSEPNKSKSLTELGLKIISTESVRAVYICTAFDSLRWMDTTANVKARILSEILFHKIMEDKLVKKLQEANYLLQSVLYGVQEHGEHDTNLHAMLTFCMQVYLGLSAAFPELRQMLMTSVDCNERTMQNFEHVVNKDMPKAKHDKHKKDAFKSVIEKVIGKNVGQHYKKPVLIRNLPPLLSLKPKKDSSLFDVEVNEDIGLCSLFAPET
ncbi:hypothetical protein JTE90_003327 [Oedothorax gibbosus]|uniref:Importin N-terminal domain-containing protein n=1 Tax=Oedothorax gibbosus TaxID=931172 RepID=A0AAV6UGQ4_9ARAC|nr:hypothetical protein JTE90_003327 [Oedothorax gibbosus]